MAKYFVHFPFLSLILVTMSPAHDLRQFSEQEKEEKLKNSVFFLKSSSWTPISPTNEIVRIDVAFAVSEINRIKKGTFRRPLVVKAAYILFKEYVCLDFVLGYTTCEVEDSTPREMCQIDTKKTPRICTRVIVANQPYRATPLKVTAFNGCE